MKFSIAKLVELVKRKPRPLGPTFEQTMDEHGWAVMVRKDSNSYHVIPINDMRMHKVDNRCWCEPVLNDDDTWVHTSSDGREEYEQGRLLQ